MADTENSDAETPKRPEDIINEFGGPATLNIQFVQAVREADDKGEQVDEETIFVRLAKQIGVKPTEVKTALQGFWSKKS